MKKFIIGLIALIGILIIFTMPIEPGNAATSNTTTAGVTATVSETISVTLSFNLSGTGITFTNLIAGTNNQSADNNLNISIDYGTNVNTNISQRGTDFSGPDTLTIGNLRYSNASGNPGLTNSTTMTTSFPSPPPYANWINISKPTGSVSQYRDTYYWLTIPTGLTAGSYTTNIYINVSKYGIG